MKREIDKNILIIIYGLVCVSLMVFCRSTYAETIKGVKDKSPGGITSGVDRESGASEFPGDERKNSVIDNFIKSCQGKKDAQCLKIRNEAVNILKEDILTLGSSADSAYLPDLAKILRSDEPVLRSAAADAMGMIRPTKSEIPELIKAFNDPVPMVRQSIKSALDASGDQEGRLIASRAKRADSSKELPDTIPDVKRLGVSPYQNSTFLYFASNAGEGKFAYSTTDTVADVVKYFDARAARKAMPKEQFMQAYSAPRGTPAAGRADMKELTAKITKLSEEFSQAVQKAVKEGRDIDKDPEIKKKQAEMDKLSKEMQRAGEDSARVERDKNAGQLLAGEYFDDRIFGSPMFIVLSETTRSGMKLPERLVVVFHDLALKKTGFVIHTP